MAGAKNNKPVLSVKELKTYFFSPQGIVRAVDGISFDVHKGEIVGLVGESACGKSVTSLSLMRLVPPPTGRIVGGEILFDGIDLLSLQEEEMREYRGKRIAMILQDPMVSLDPLFRIGNQISEAIRYHEDQKKQTLRSRVIELLRKVKVPSPEVRIDDYPFQFSGGMSQRCLIAMGISCQPDLLIADEPTTALDVTIQAQILRLLREIQRESNTAIILITHDLAVVAQLCKRILVMYAGRIIEQGDINTIFENPAHPYSVGLIRSVPVLGKRVKELYTIEGQPPDLMQLPPGCSFGPRCNRRMEICAQEYPPETRLAEGHIVRCWLYQ
ncbi:MAG: ABC transporter ATP-binding protein [Deltaproteobacteria bacterium]|nr:ABC transporter ATP-binding protein [Deltaproteobacteria bacterium]MBW2084685.1 ABC transporter ATP-binding protein [Deltaproteobacteria bacterium]